MTDVFGSLYSDAYDALYATKDYDTEADLIARVLAREGKPGRCRILDLGCGTGNHSVALARRGYDVVGVDQSAAMLGFAGAKALALPVDLVRPVFLVGDIRSVEASGSFDAAIMMFTVLGYMHEDRDILAALGTARRHLDPGGLLIFDVWNGLAVLADEPKARSLAVTQGEDRLLRQTEASLDHARRVCRIHFTLRRTDAVGQTMQATEDHAVRYFFEEELATMLQSCDFDLVRLSEFPSDRLPLAKSTWNMLGVARARCRPRDADAPEARRLEQALGHEFITG